MLFTHNLHGVSQSQVFGSENVPMLEPLLQCREMKMPSKVSDSSALKVQVSDQQSVGKQRYSQSELASAAMMLRKMKNRDDVAPKLFPQPINADRVLDAVADRLLDRLASAPEDFKFPQMKLVCAV